jgi:hypothetical protein
MLEMDSDPTTNILLVQDFNKKVTVKFPAAGSDTTPKHNLPDFNFTSYSPKGFRYFRQVFGISDQNFVSNIIT